MDGFNWDVDGETIRIIFSLIRNAQWLNDEAATAKDAIVFEYLDHPYVCVMQADLDLEGSEYDRELWNMLLQATDLDPT